jgi:hypothetical protein
MTLEIKKKKKELSHSNNGIASFYLGFILIVGLVKGCYVIYYLI